MWHTVELLQSTKLFSDIDSDQLMRMLDDESVRLGRYRRGEVVICEGDENDSIGVILSGSITAERVYPDGEVAAASAQGVGGVIGDVLSGSSAKSPVTVIAAEQTEILFFPLSLFIAPPPEYAGIQPVLTRNLIADISDKYFELERRVGVLSAGTLRRRISLYLCHRCSRCPGEWFTVPHTREQQAVYLGCERTALSRELARMKRDGLIDYRGNRFRIVAEGHICRMLET